MKPERLLLFALLAAAASAGSARARDPFTPAETLSCRAERPLWQLRGIVGQKGDYRAWLVFSPHQWVQKKPGEQLDDRWHLAAVDALSITVDSAQACQPPMSFTLKGKLYDQDDNSAIAGVP
ncbi:HofP DNA utilization family protein [Erwinia sp. 9145]|uniref:HofP DNA utilization family protein n=1 Tax=Erwinia sp. 9145 TaxID=1500895 RepID=UPI000550FB3B|nr:HofP DNA utilization family protein [Erwinia sp. 9145]